MRYQLFFSFRDILKKKYIIILLIIEMLFTLLFFSFTSIQVLIGSNQIKMCNQLRDKNIIYFKFNGKEANYTKEIHDSLIKKWANNEAYSIINFYSLEDYAEYNVIITLGAFDEVFGLNKLYNKENDETICYLGSNVKGLEIDKTVNFGQLGNGYAKIVSRIPKRMNYMIGERVEAFDNTIVISTNIEYFKELFYPLGIIDNTTFINPSDDFLKSYVRALENASGHYEPSSLNQYAKSIKKFLIDDGLSASILFFFVLIFVFINIVIIILQIIDSNMREYSIHLLYGATFKDIFIRTFFTISVIIAPTIFIFNNFFSALLIGKKLSIPAIILIYIVSTLLLSIVSLWKIKNLELEDYFERNE